MSLSEKGLPLEQKVDLEARLEGEEHYLELGRPASHPAPFSCYNSASGLFGQVTLPARASVFPVTNKALD